MSLKKSAILILTDSQFLVPFAALLIGVALLVGLH